MEVVFHIGTNKTGTSAIQGFLDKNPEFLLRHGWVYPKAGRNGRPLHGPLAITPPDLLPQVVSDIEKEAQDNRVILSSEYFHTIDPSHILAAFGGHSIRTVVFLRDHISYLSSWYREAIKSDDKTYSFWDFATLIHKPYYLWLDKWPNLTVVDYNSKTLINHSSVDHFLSLLDIPLTQESTNVVENLSISGNLLFAKQIYNNVITEEEMRSFRSEMQTLLHINPTFSGPMAIDERVYSYIIEKYAYDCEVIERRYNIPLSPPSSPAEGHPSPNLETLSSDIEQIIDFSYEHDLEFGKKLSRVFFVHK
jgi:hypothetical protein